MKGTRLNAACLCAELLESLRNVEFVKTFLHLYQGIVECLPSKWVQRKNLALSVFLFPCYILVPAEPTWALHAKGTLIDFK